MANEKDIDQGPANTLSIEVDSRKQFTGEIPVPVHEESVVGALGSSIKLASDRKVPFSYELACKHLELAEFIGERPLDNEHVSFLLAQAKEGTFHPEWVTWIAASCAEDGKDYRINGQHTGWMRLGMGEKWPEAGDIRYQKYECKTLDDVRILYSSTDRGKARSRSQVLNSYLHGTEDFAGLSQSILKMVSSGMSFWLWESFHDRKRHTADAVAALMRTEHLNICLFVGQLVTKMWAVKDGRMATRSPVIASMFSMASKATKSAEEFWMSVRDGVGFSSKNDPRLKLRTTLMQARLNTKSPGVRVMSPEEMYRCCIHAWNAWRKGEELQNLRAPTSSRRPTAK